MIGLRELESSERILSISSLIKEGVDFWNEDVRPSDDQTEANSKLDAVADDIDSCMLNPDAVQVSAVIAGYAARKVIAANGTNERRWHWLHPKSTKWKMRTITSENA